MTNRRVGCSLLVVAGSGVLASGNLKRIANAVLVRVLNARSVAVVGKVCKFARVVARVGFVVVVAGGRVQAAQHHVEAAAIVVRRVDVVVVRFRVGASRNFERIAHPVAVRVCQAVAVAIVPGIGKRAVTRREHRSRVVVACNGVQTTRT